MLTCTCSVLFNQSLRMKGWGLLGLSGEAWSFTELQLTPQTTEKNSKKTAKTEKSPSKLDGLDVDSFYWSIFMFDISRSFFNSFFSLLVKMHFQCQSCPMGIVKGFYTVTFSLSFQLNYFLFSLPQQALMNQLIISSCSFGGLGFVLNQHYWSIKNIISWLLLWS